VTPKLVFLIEQAPEGGFVARDLGHSIYTEADTWHELNTTLQDAVACHLGEELRFATFALKRQGE
jgi:hypothetical protein